MPLAAGLSLSIGTTMTFRQSFERRPNTIGRDEQIVVLEDGRGGRVEVWPGQGFNAFRWRAPSGAELLFATDTFFQGDRPSRSGIPVLFPFPNRIRAGRYIWEGKSYQLPLNDPAAKNAIHGFAYTAAWRVIDAGADGTSAWVTGEFQISRDAPSALTLWPADARLRLTHRLRASALALEATVDNPGTTTLPFGLGYHPYFTIAPFGGEAAIVSAPAPAYWELVENLPTGAVQPVSGGRDLRTGKPMSELKLDDVLTRLQGDLVGSMHHVSGKPALEVRAATDYRDLVAFTPPHRQAVCLEPYTCTTDAINLQAQGIDAGLRVLRAGESWRGDVVLSYQEK
jgi:aldose 1-epimerase